MKQPMTGARLAGRILLALASFVLVVASLGIDQTAHSRSEARHLGFGYPLHFASSDFASYYSPPSYPHTFTLNPWEIPVSGNPLAFLVSWVLVYGALFALWRLVRAAGAGVVRRPRRTEQA
jgi:hypothetical protein